MKSIVESSDKSFFNSTGQKIKNILYAYGTLDGKVNYIGKTSQGFSARIKQQLGCYRDRDVDEFIAMPLSNLEGFDDRRILHAEKSIIKRKGFPLTNTHHNEFRSWMPCDIPKNLDQLGELALRGMRVNVQDSDKGIIRALLPSLVLEPGITFAEAHEFSDYIHTAHGLNASGNCVKGSNINIVYYVYKVIDIMRIVADFKFNDAEYYLWMNFLDDFLTKVDKGIKPEKNSPYE